MARRREASEGSSSAATTECQPNTGGVRMADSGEAGDKVKKHDGVIIVNLRKGVNGISTQN